MRKRVEYTLGKVTWCFQVIKTCIFHDCILVFLRRESNANVVIVLRLTNLSTEMVIRVKDEAETVEKAKKVLIIHSDSPNIQVLQTKKGTSKPSMSARC